MEQEEIRDSESGSVQVPRAVRTPGPWHQYAKTVKAGNLCGFDVTADGNHKPDHIAQVVYELEIEE